MVIKPTIGRVVWYYPPGAKPDTDSGCQPHAALVAYVFTDGRVNLAAFDDHGRNYEAGSVLLIQEGEDFPEGGNFCTWMPYQIGQAKKYEGKAEAK